MNINNYMELGISQLMKTASKYYLNNPKGIAFLSKMIPEIKKSNRIRKQNEQKGTQVPPLIIASITSQCNLHCAGCYSRATGGCSDEQSEDLTGNEWGRILKEASALGVSFIMLAGGEPLMRKDIIEIATGFPNMFFPTFTNGTMIDKDYLDIFEKNRNLIPIFSIEGNENKTDDRRGEGTYGKLKETMRYFKNKKIMFGSSITVTEKNMNEVSDQAFMKELKSNGCGVVFFVEYVPIEEGTESLMLKEESIKKLQSSVGRLKNSFDDMIMLSFPGDEEMMGGCLASGRGFFHINANGGAEPCPFSPHSKINLKEDSIETVLKSGFFRDLRTLATSVGHNGGCTLFEHNDEVVTLLNE